MNEAQMQATNLQLHSIQVHIRRARISLEQLAKIIEGLRHRQPEMDPTAGGVRSQIGLDQTAAQVQLQVSCARELEGHILMFIKLICPFGLLHALSV
jgi:hypothetical protein